MYRYLSLYKVIHSGVTKYPLLVFNKSVISNFRAFLLAPVTQIILGYLLFLLGSQNGASFCDSLRRRNFSVKRGNCCKKATKFGLSVLTAGKIILLLNLQLFSFESRF